MASGQDARANSPLTSPDVTGQTGQENGDSPSSHRRPSVAQSMASGLSNAVGVVRHRIGHNQDGPRVTFHVETAEARREYLMKLAHALMSNGAPSHRLEDYLTMSALALNMRGIFFYLPGMIFMSLGAFPMDMVRSPSGTNLGKQSLVHDVYKHVLHDKIGAGEGIRRLDSISNTQPRFNALTVIMFYGLASLSVGPFAFGLDWFDLVPAFGLGCLMGWIIVHLSPKTSVSSIVVENCATILMTFVTRALGSVPIPGDLDPKSQLFCFPGLLQSSIALILPGYAVLLGCIEVLAGSFIAGVSRLASGIFRALFLGFSITIGATLYGALYANAPVNSRCAESMDSRLQFIFVSLFTVSLMVVNQANFRQWPLMMVIALSGYTVNAFSSRRFPSNTPMCSALAGLTISLMANATSRLGPNFGRRLFSLWRAISRGMRSIKRAYKSLLRGRRNVGRGSVTRWHGSLERLRFSTSDQDVELGNRRPSQAQGSSSTPHTRPGTPSAGVDPNRQASDEEQTEDYYVLAAAAMLPAMFVLVPSGLAVAGSLIEGMENAQILASPSPPHGSSGDAVGGAPEPADVLAKAPAMGNSSFQVGIAVVLVGMGIAGGMAAGNLIMYPRGRKNHGFRGQEARAHRSGLFSF